MTKSYMVIKCDCIYSVELPTVSLYFILSIRTKEDMAIQLRKIEAFSSPSGYNLPVNNTKSATTAILHGSIQQLLPTADRLMNRAASNPSSQEKTP